MSLSSSSASRLALLAMVCVCAGTASFVKQLTTGRVGILHHVLPELEYKLEPCGPVQDGELEDGSPRYVSRGTECTMGDGGTFIGLRTYGPGGAVRVRGDRVFRPTSGVSRVRVSLWLNRSGSVIYGDPEEFALTLGWPVAEGARPLLAGWQATLLDAGPDASLENAGIELTEFERPDEDGHVHLIVQASELYCPAEGERHSARVRVRATATDVLGRPLNPVRPRISHRDDLDGAAAEEVFDVLCPGADPTAAVVGVERGQELVESSGAGSDR